MTRAEELAEKVRRRMDWSQGEKAEAADAALSELVTLAKEGDDSYFEVSRKMWREKALKSEADAEALAEALEESCPDCGGTGYLSDGRVCEWCNSTGKVIADAVTIAAALARYRGEK